MLEEPKKRAFTAIDLLLVVLVVGLVAAAVVYWIDKKTTQPPADPKPAPAATQ